jgi:threonine dehydrogenase-like Zn-dependent dehydrogenase
MSIYDKIGLQDMTTDDTYFERGISQLHGYLAEYYADSADFIVRVPKGLSQVGVLLEPSSVAEKAIGQAYEVQRRLRVWKPKRAAVLGAGTLGLLASLFLRLRGIQVTTFGLAEAPYLNSDLLGEIGVRYIATKQMSLKAASAKYGPFDFILEGTGFSPLVFEAMEVLGKDGVLAMVSITGADRKLEVPADRINQGFVLGNKVALGSVNASREDFERAVLDLSAAELSFPGWLARLLTHPVKGLENHAELMEKLTSAKGAIKVYCEVNGDMH